MTAAGWALQKAVYAALAADASLKALIGDPPRVHDHPPQKPVYPFVLFGEARETRIPGTDQLSEHDIRLAIHSRYEGRKEIKAVEAAIRAVLDGAALTLEDHALISLRVVAADIFYRTDADAHQGQLRFRAVTERV